MSAWRAAVAREGVGGAQALLANYRVLEARLEAGGVSTKSLHIHPMDIDLEGVR